MTTDNTTVHQLPPGRMSTNVYSTSDNLEYHSAQWDTGLPFEKPVKQTEAIQTTSEVAESENDIDNAHYEAKVKAVNADREIEKLNSTLHSFGFNNEEVLKVEVGNPEKHGEGVKDAYVTYEVKTKTMLESFHSPTNLVKRRYNDFLWLKRRLQTEFPASILPPLPEKQRLDYLDRFNPEFIAKRQLALHRFMEHLAVHPVIQRSDLLRNFLETPYLPTENTGKKDSLMENFSDAVLNAFSKLQDPDERFIQMKSNVTILDDHLRILDKISSKVLHDQRSISLKLSEAALRYQELNEDSPMLGAFTEKFAEALKAEAEELDRLSGIQETGLFNVIKEYIHYCRNAKVTLKQRDQRQLDYEDLSEFLKNHISEKEKVASLRPGQTTNLSSFIHKKIDDMKGVDQVKAKQTKLAKLDLKIKELQQAVDSSKEILTSFNNHMVKEYQFFELLKTKDFKKAMTDTSKGTLEYHKKMHETWTDVLKSLE